MDMTGKSGAIGEFSGQFFGRSGQIIYREPPKELSIYWEISIHDEEDGSRAYGLGVTCDLQFWSNHDPISEQHQLEILAALREWMHAQGKRSTIDLPNDLTEEDASCLYKKCPHRRIKGLYYCRQHFDLSCLVAIR